MGLSAFSRELGNFDLDSVTSLLQTFLSTGRDEHGNYRWSWAFYQRSPAQTSLVKMPRSNFSTDSDCRQLSSRQVIVFFFRDDRQ